MHNDKRGSNHLKMSDVRCSHTKCGENNGRGAGSPVRRPIKQSIVDKLGADRPLFCYPCQQYMKRINQGAKVMTAGR